MALYILNKKTGQYDKSSNQNTVSNNVPKIGTVKQNVRQTPKYLDAVSNAQKLKLASQEANSNFGITKNFVKGLPGAFATTMVQTPLKLGATALELPNTFRRKEASQKVYKVPGIEPFQSFQSSIENAGVDYYTGKKTGRDKAKLAWEVAQLPLSVLETVGIGKGLSRGAKVFKGANGVSQGIRKATPEILDAFIPTKKTKPKQSQPLQEGVKQRGFISTLKESQYTSPKTKKLLTDANYTPQGNDELIKEASRQIKKDISGAREKALLGDDNQSVANAMELIKHYQNVGDHDQAAEIAKVVAEKLTEHGRTIQAASLYNKLTPEGIVRYAQKVASKEGVSLNGKQTKELYNMAVEAQGAKGEDKAIKTFRMLDRLQEFIPSKLSDQSVTMWKAGLLTNPTTHLANLMGNTTMSGMEMLKDIPATALDKVASLFTGKRTKTLPNVLNYGKGALEGARKAWIFMKTGTDVDNILGKIDYKKVNLPPVLKQYTQTIFRALGAEDKVFKGALFQKSLGELATVNGINKGLKGAELSKYAKKLMQNPTTEMIKNATEDALYGTFNSPNNLASSLGNSAAANVVAPFRRTPLNIAKAMWDYSPGGLFTAGKRALNNEGQRKIVEALGRATVGSGIIGAGYGMGKSGRMTGNYPANPTERNLWELTGKQPGSIKMGDKWLSTNRISPVGNLLSTGSGMADLGRIKPENIPLSMLGVAGKNLLGQTYLQGVSGMLNAVQNPVAYGSNWAESLAQGVVPSIIGATTRAIDPIMRERNSIGESIQSRIPGLSQYLQPKQDVFGKERLYNEPGVGQYVNPFVNPFNPSRAKDTPLTDEINRLYQEYSGVSLGDASKTIGIQGTGVKIDMTPEEYSAMNKQTGGLAKGILEKVIKSKEYGRLSDYDKARAINEIISKIRQLWNVKNLGNLSNTRQQFQEQIQKQYELRKPNPFYTK